MDPGAHTAPAVGLTGTVQPLLAKERAAFFRGSLGPIATFRHNNGLFTEGIT